MAKGDDIEDRLIDFGVVILKLCEELPRSLAGKHVARQLVRSGTSPAPNYGEARGAESRQDFIHKVKLAVKELNESQIWLKMILRSAMLPADRLAPVLAECEELSRILTASAATATRNRRKR